MALARLRGFSTRLWTLGTLPQEGHPAGWGGHGVRPA